jgi:hypothetical protein
MKMTSTVSLPRSLPHRLLRVLLATLSLMAVSAPVTAQKGPAGPGGVERAIELTLKALPPDAELSPDKAWWASIDEIARPQLQGARERTAARVTEVFQHHSAGSFGDFDAWFAAVGRPSIALSERAVRGDWKCRAVHVNASGSLAFPFHHCVVRQRGPCLELAKESGRRWAGCLHRVDDHSFALVQTRQHYRELSRVDGFLSGSSAAHLRLLVQRSHSLDVYEFIRQ